MIQLRFLRGHWRGEHDGGVFEEFWTNDDGGMMTSTSKLVINGETKFFEFGRIEVVDGQVTLLVQPLGRSPTYFQLKRSAFEKRGRGAEFVNPEHDFPRLIRYSIGYEIGGTVLVVYLEGEENGKFTTDTIRMYPVDQR